MNKEYKITVKHVLNTRLKGVGNGVKTFYPLYVQVNCRRQFTKFPSKWDFDFAVEDFDLEKKKISNILNKEIEEVTKIIKILDPNDDNFQLKSLTTLYQSLCKEMNLVEYIQDILKDKIIEYGESLIDKDLVEFEMYKLKISHYNSYLLKKTDPVQVLNDLLTPYHINELRSKYHTIVWHIKEWVGFLCNDIRNKKLAIPNQYYIINFINGDFEQDLNNYFKMTILNDKTASIFDKGELLEITKEVINSIKGLLQDSMKDWKKWV